MFAKVDIDKHTDLSDEHRIQYVPTVFFVKRGKVIHKIVGGEDHENLNKGVKRLLADGEDQ